MANTKSAKKRVRRNGRRTEVNHARVSRVRTFIRKIENAIEGSDKSAAQQALKEAQPEIMRGVGHGVMHRNTASRKISRLSARIKGLS